MRMASGSSNGVQARMSDMKEVRPRIEFLVRPKASPMPATMDVIWFAVSAHKTIGFHYDQVLVDKIREIPTCAQKSRTPHTDVALKTGSPPKTQNTNTNFPCRSISPIV